MVDKIKVGIIGLGRISSLHLSAYKPENKLNAELFAVCDKNKTRAQEVAKEFNVEHVYTNYKDLLANEEIEAVEILTPHHLHAEQTIKAAEAGKHISLQKVPAMTLSEMDAMIAATKKNKVRFRVYENFRFYPPYQFAMNLIEQGVIGKTERVDCRMWNGLNALSDWKVPLLSWKWRFSEKGNYKSPQLFDDGYHKHSIIAQFLGEPIDSVLAWKGEFKIKGVLTHDTPAVVIYSCKDKSHYGTWNVSLHNFLPMESDHYACDEYVEIIGEKGAIFIPGCTGNFFESCGDSAPGQAGVHWVDETGKWKSELNLDTSWASSFMNCSREFIEGIREDREIDLNPKEARYILKIGLAIVRSIRNNFREVKLKEILDAP
ncbi:MAG: Gfo/Idh/MocA family protein [Candidatus Heimdallarchaeaceae archaeon]